MRTSILAMLAVLAMLGVAGCNTAEAPHLTGITPGGGEAMAHNSALQIIDPWPPGVQDADFAVSAGRASDGEGPANAADAGNGGGQAGVAIAD